MPHGEQQSIRPPQPIPRAGRSLLFLGRREPYKGVPVLVDAFQRTAARFPDWRLVLAGFGSSRLPDGASGDARIEVHDRFVPDGEAARMLASAGALVLPYLEASQTGLIPTAYAFARPVVASRVGGLPEAVEHGVTGLLVPPGDAAALAAALEAIMADPESAMRMGQAGQRKLHAELAWARTAADVAGL